MRHRVYGKHLGRDKNQRTALFKSLVGSLILHGSIETSEAKAKAIKGLVDKLISDAKSKNTQILVNSYLTQKKVQDQLFKVVVPGVKSRNSGFTSTVRLGPRLGDNSMQVRMTLLIDDSSKPAKAEKAEIVAEENEVEPIKKAAPKRKPAAKKAEKK